MAEKKVSVRLVAENGRQVRAELEGVGDAGARGFQRMSKEIDTAGVMLTRLAGIAAGAFSIRQVAQYADTWTDLRSRVDLATGSQERGAAVMDRLASMARRTYSSLENTTESWLSNSRALRDLGMSTAESLGFTEALNNALVVSGARAERAASVQNALSRAMAAGKLSGDQLNTIIETGGRVAELLAEKLGTTVSGLRTMGQQGKITGDVIRTALVGNLELLREEADSMPATIGDAFTLIGNAALQLVGSWDQLLGASSTVADVLILVADNLERLASIGIAFAAFMAGRWVAAFVAARVATFSLATALTALRTALIRTGIGALIVLAGELIYQFSSLVKSVGGIGTAFKLLGGLAVEVGQRIGTAFQAAFALLGAAWHGYQALVYTVLDLIVKGTVTAVDRYVAVWAGAFESVKAIWSKLPAAIGDFAFQAANGLIAGVEAMLNGVVTRINNFITGINNALAMLPEWAVGEGGISLGTLDPFSLGRIDNPFEGGAAAAGTAAADAFVAAFDKTYVEAPDLFGDLASEASAAAAGYLDAAREFGEATVRPLESWQALKDAMTASGEEGANALDDAANAADRVAAATDRAGGAAGRAGAAGKKAGKDAKEGADEALQGWDAVAKSLTDYADKARNIGGDIGGALVGAFQSAENAVGDFVNTGKLNFRDLVTSMLADLAKLGARRFLLGPLAGILSGFMPGLGAGGLFANLFHSGGEVGTGGPGRMVPAMAFAGAPRMHNGGWTGLRSDEVPAILQRGERVLSRREARRIRQPGHRQHQCPRCGELPAESRPDRRRYRAGRVDGQEGNVMAFHEIRFPDNISRGARGGPERRTQIVELASGDEERNASWANSRRRYDVSYGIRRADDLAAVVAFFEARNGRLHGFRFKDWSDYKSCAPSGIPASADQQIGTGDGIETEFQLVKRYTSGSQAWPRTITKPVAGSVTVRLDAAEQPSGWSVDLATGIVTFAAAPGNGVVVRAGVAFDVPVRFDSDVLDVTLDIERLGSITSIPLIEIRR